MVMLNSHELRGIEYVKSKCIVIEFKDLNQWENFIQNYKDFRSQYNLPERLRKLE